MKVLFVINTHYQLMLAIRLAMTAYKDDEKDIILSDISTHMEEIYLRLNKMSLFNNVFFSRERIWRESRGVSWKKITIIANVLKRKPSVVIKAISNFSELGKYDFVCCYNQSAFLTCLLRFLACPKVVLLNEGVLSYYIPIICMRSDLITRRFYEVIIGEKVINSNTQMYLSMPELVDKSISTIMPVKVPDVDMEAYRQLLNEVYDYQFNKEDYLEKYIIFEDAFMADGFDIDDENLFVDIVDKVGNKNIVVKLHPRTRIDRYAKYGIKTIKASFMPWELICLNEKIHDRCFITIRSTSTINAVELLGDGFLKTNKIIMLYNFDKLQNKIQNYLPSSQLLTCEIERFLSASGTAALFPKNEQELVDIL